MGQLRAVLALAAVLCAVPGVATASTVSVDPITGRAVLVGGSGPNDVKMDTSRRVPGAPFGPALMFIEAAQDLNVGAGCIAGLPVWCQAVSAEINLDDEDDRYHGFSDGDIIVNGGTGADHIYANGLWNAVSGGRGADWINVGGNTSSSASGDSGDDNIRAVTTSVVSLTGGSGDDLVYGDRDRNALSGDSGDDALIIGGFRPRGAARGGSGGDVMLVDRSRRGSSVEFSGGIGGDVIVGGLSTDTVSGDRGTDVIDVSGDAEEENPEPDSVECGSGNDTVYADPEDVVADDCENRLDGRMPPSKRVDAALARLADAFGVTIAG